jgi:hypothetical protein
MRARYVISLLLLAVACAQAFAQIEGTQYFMNSLPQYVGNNPAFFPRYKFALGLPGSMIDVSYSNNGFNYNDLTRKENGKRIADLSRLAKALPEKTYITTTAQIDLFRLGLRITPSAYLSLNSSVRAYGRGMIPRDIISLIADGNEQYVGKTASISPEMEMMMFWENSAGLAVSPTEDLTVGARIKILRGFVNANTATANVTIAVADNYSATLAADLNVRTSGIQNFEQDFRLSNYSGNNGMAVDLGATYRLLDKLTLAASIVDLGAIKWKNDTYQYTLNKATANFTYSGADITRLIEGDGDYFQSFADSLEANFKPEEKQGSAYSTMLPAKMHASASYEVMKNFSVGTVLYAENFRGRFATGWTLAANKHFGRFLSTSVSYTVANRSFNNLGAGLSLNLAPIQIYIVGDNLLRLPFSAAANKNLNEYINSTQVFNLRVGMNFVWGWMTDSGKKVEDKSFNSKKKGVKTSSDKSRHPSPSQINVRKKKK